MRRPRPLEVPNRSRSLEARASLQGPCLLADVPLELRLLPSAGMTRLPRYSKPRRHPAGPSWPSRVPGGRVRATARASRVASAPLRAQAGAPAPAEATGFVSFATLFGGVSGRWPPSPACRRAGLRINPFGACSTFPRVPACALAEPPAGGPFPSACFRPHRYLWQPLRVLPAGTNSCRAGLPPAEGRCLGTANDISTLL